MGDQTRFTLVQRSTAVPKAAPERVAAKPERATAKKEEPKRTASAKKPAAKAGTKDGAKKTPVPSKAARPVKRK
jgi:hypothetical protein